MCWSDTMIIALLLTTRIGCTISFSRSSGNPVHYSNRCACLLATGQVFSGVFFSIATAQVLNRAPALRPEMQHLLVLAVGAMHTLVCARKAQLMEMISRLNNDLSIASSDQMELRRVRQEKRQLSHSTTRELIWERAITGRSWGKT